MMTRRTALKTGAVVAGGALAATFLTPGTAQAATVEDGYLILDPEEQRALVHALDFPVPTFEGTEYQIDYYELTRGANVPPAVRKRLRAVQLAFVSNGPPSSVLPYGVFLTLHGAECAKTLKQNYDLRNADL